MVCIFTEECFHQLKGGGEGSQLHLQLPAGNSAAPHGSRLHTGSMAAPAHGLLALHREHGFPAGSQLPAGSPAASRAPGGKGVASVQLGSQGRTGSLEPKGHQGSQEGVGTLGSSLTRSWDLQWQPGSEQGCSADTDIIRSM